MITKRKKPNFLRQDAHKVKRLSQKWRKPRGMHNKMKFGYTGHRVSPNIGYGAPKEIKGLVDGLKPLLIKNENDLKNADSIKNILIISGKLGRKKRVHLLEKIKGKFKVLNVDVEKFLADVRADIEKKKKEKTEKKEEAKKEQKKEEVKTEKKEESKEIKSEKKETKHGPRK